MPLVIEMDEKGIDLVKRFIYYLTRTGEESMNAVSRKLLVVLALVGAIAAQRASAVIIAADNASSAPYNDGWQNGDNGGFGFGAWGFGGFGTSGGFIGDSTANAGGSGGINTTVGPDANVSAPRSWGTFANPGALFDAHRSIPTLSQESTLSLRMDNGFIRGPSDGSPNGSVGVSFRSTPTFKNMLEFFFTGGDASYTYLDGDGFHATGIGFTGNGLTLGLHLTSASTYSLVVSNGDSTVLLGTFAGNLGNNTDGHLSLALNDVRPFNFSAQRFAGDGAADAFFNSFQVDAVVAAVPEPTMVAMLGLGGIIIWFRRRRDAKA